MQYDDGTKGVVKGPAIVVLIVRSQVCSKAEKEVQEGYPTSKIGVTNLYEHTTPSIVTSEWRFPSNTIESTARKRSVYAL